MSPKPSFSSARMAVAFPSSRQGQFPPSRCAELSAACVHPPTAPSPCPSCRGRGEPGLPALGLTVTIGKAAQTAFLQPKANFH